MTRLVVGPFNRVEGDLEVLRLGLRVLILQQEGRQIRSRLQGLRQFGGGRAQGDIDTARSERHLRLINDPDYVAGRFSKVQI